MGPAQSQGVGSSQKGRGTMSSSSPVQGPTQCARPDFDGTRMPDCFSRLLQARMHRQAKGACKAGLNFRMCDRSFDHSEHVMEYARALLPPRDRGRLVAIAKPKNSLACAMCKRVHRPCAFLLVEPEDDENGDYLPWAECLCCLKRNHPRHSVPCVLAPEIARQPVSAPQIQPPPPPPPLQEPENVRGHPPLEPCTSRPRCTRRGARKMVVTAPQDLGIPPLMEGGVGIPFGTQDGYPTPSGGGPFLCWTPPGEEFFDSRSPPHKRRHWQDNYSL